MAPTKIRSQSSYVDTDVPDAFDAIISLPLVTLDPSIRFSPATDGTTQGPSA